MRKVLVFITVIAIVASLCFLSACGIVNTNYDPNFTEDGYLIKNDSFLFEMKQPSTVKFYIEVSGSMNGFFRANRPTDFKADLWKVLNYYSPISNEINILTNDGNVGRTIPLNNFQTLMNTGAFVSAASTKVPVMLKSIINNLDTNDDEVAVLVSDMKYSPVGAAAPAVLMTQYSTDISEILGKFNQTVSLICATSDYLDNKGNVICQKSPYYYFILGKQEHVARMRNEISSLLENTGHFVDNIESGFNYGNPKYSFGISNKCDRLYEEPTFIAYEEVEDGDTCTIKLNVQIEDYRWRMADESIFANAFKANTIYGSALSIGNITIVDNKVTGQDRYLDRKATATIDLKLYNMVTESDVIEWTLDLPDTDYTLFNPFFVGATDENDPSKSYSVLDFIKGIFAGGLVTKEFNWNYILVSKNS